MSKAKKIVKPQKVKEGFLSNFDLESILPQKYHILAVVLIIFILFLAFLSPMYFGGKTFQSGDIIATKSMQPYIEKDRDGFSLWNPHIFCGMPAYGIGTTFPWFNLIATVFTFFRDIFTSFFAVEYSQWSFYLILLGITSFFFMRYVTKNTLVSLFTGVATAFSTGIIVFLFIGHVTKLTSLCFYPLLFLILYRFQEKIKIIDFLFLVIVMQLLIQGFHVQIIFYTVFAVGIYYLYYFIRSLVKKENEKRNNLLKSAGLFAFASIIAILISADNLTQIYEYTPYSTRGTVGILESTTGKTEQSESDFYDYHTNWSFSPGEVLTFIIPSYYGFGNVKYQGPLTKNQEVEVNTYFGQMPFVDVAMYMGVLVFFFALFAIFTRWKEPMVQFLTILSAVALLISFGKTFPVLFDILFYNLPYFDKFRVPSMILVLVQLSMPVLAGLGIMKVISLRNEPDAKAMNLLKYGAYIFTGFFVLGILLGGSLSTWFTERINDYAAGVEKARPQLAQQYRALSEFASGMFTGDFLVAFAFSALAFWGSVVYVGRKISSDILITGIILLTVIDLWRIDSRGAKYSDSPDIQNMFSTPDYITAIKNQKEDEPFRMLNMKQDGSLGSFNQNSNFNAYFLVEDFYGYSGIKPRAYQDLMDVVGPFNETLWRMLNVKYLIFDRQAPLPGLSPIYSGEKSFVYKNENVLPRVYLVDSVALLPNIDVLKMIKENSFDPKTVAYVHETKPDVEKPDSTAYVKILHYSDENTKAEVNASGNNFVFFGNTYMPAGWKALLNNEEVDIHRTNHGFMGVVVTKGKHTLEFVYAPSSFYMAKYLVLILSSVVMLGMITTSFFEFRKNKLQGKSK